MWRSIQLLVLLSLLSCVFSHRHRHHCNQRDEDNEEYDQTMHDEHPPCRGRHCRHRDSKFIHIGGLFTHRARKPEKLIIYNTERYGNWSEWSECLLKDCIQIRSRQCLDNSWESPIYDRMHTTRCLSKFIAEKRNCTDKSKCFAQVGAQMLENLTETCGIRSNEGVVYPKITGGQEAVPNSWPWVVRLAVKPPGGKSTTFCGGTLIAPQWVLTAAHCLLVENKMMPVGKPVKLSEHMKSSIYAYFGDHDQRKKEPTQVERRVTDAILHPKYHRKLMTDGDDIALLYLPEPVNISTHILYSCLPSKNFLLKPGTKCYALGWGNQEGGRPPTFGDLQSILDSFFMPIPDLFGSNLGFGKPGYLKARPTRKPRRKDTSSTVVQVVELPIVSAKECRRHYADLNEDVHICAGQKGKDTCAGDSGGGLYCMLPDSDRWYVAGVTSFGLVRGCGLTPGVYTSISAHMDWISNQMATIIY